MTEEDQERPPQRIKLRNWQQGGNSTLCSCTARIRWATTVAGKRIPLEADAVVDKLPSGQFEVNTDYVHFAHCPDGKRHRKE